MPRYLGIDYGLKRIGLAVSDPEGRVASPLKQLGTHKDIGAQAEQFREVIEEYDIEALVIGLPLMEDGSEGEQVRKTRKFGDALAGLLDLPVEYWDERYSSHHADRLLDQREELTRRKRRARQDALAAQIILQTFLDARRAE